MRHRLRSVVRFSALVVLVRDDAQSVWTVELAEGVRLPAHLTDRDLPAAAPAGAHEPAPGPDRRPARPPRRRRVRGAGPQRPVHRAPRPGRARRADRARRRRARRVRAASSATCIESLSSLLALSIDNARWFGRLRTLGAEAERARIARELHDRVAQSLAYVAFELERMQRLPGDKDAEIAELRVVVRDIVRELRETIYQLRANVSEDEDIVMVAGGYLERFAERTGIATHWLPSASAALPYRIEQELWRIGQEALVNVERHADATEVDRPLGRPRRRRPPRGRRQRRGFEPGRGRRRALRPRGDAGTCRCDRCAARDREPARPRDRVVVELAAAAASRHRERRSA